MTGHRAELVELVGQLDTMATAMEANAGKARRRRRRRELLTRAQGIRLAQGVAATRLARADRQP